MAGEGVLEAILRQIEDNPAQEDRNAFTEKMFVHSLTTLQFEGAQYLKRVNQMEEEKRCIKDEIRELKRKINRMNTAYSE